MSTEHTPTDDIWYDMISIQYHALKASEAYDKYIEDAHDHAEVAEFIRQCKQQDLERATRCHQLMKELGGAREHQNA